MSAALLLAIALSVAAQDADAGPADDSAAVDAGPAVEGPPGAAPVEPAHVDEPVPPARPPPTAPISAPRNAPSIDVHDALRVRWDCYLPSVSVDCTQLESAFFQAMPMLARSDDDRALHVSVRAFLISGGVDYTLALASHDGESVRIHDRVPSSFSDDALAGGGGGGGAGGGGGGGADSGGGGGRGTGGGSSSGRARRGDVVIVRLVADLQRAITPFLSLERPATAGRDGLTLVLRSPHAGPAEARADDVTARWYVSPSVTVNVAQTALLTLQGSGALQANWSTPQWRLLADANADAAYLSAPSSVEGQPAQSYGYVGGAARATAVNVVHDGFSIGVTPFVATDPQRNHLVRIAGYGGVEWVLLPFLATNGGNVGARYVIGGEHQEYVHLNERQRFEENFLRHQALVFASWHLDRIDLASALSASSIVDDLAYSDVAASASVSWRVLNDLSLTLTGSAAYRNALINAPDNLNDLDPLERFVGGGNFGALTYTARLSIVYALGNSLLLRQDQRWTNGDAL